MQDTQTLIFLEYLDCGLIPVKDFSAQSIEQFDKFLKDLSQSDRRKVNRKFRKIFRKILKRESLKMRNRKMPPSWIATYGIGLEKPTKGHLRARRRLVHKTIFKTISESKNG